MKIIICPDSFKGSLSASGAAEAIERGILRAAADSPVCTVKIPLADGGEGTAEAMRGPLGGEMVSVDVHDPLMRPISASYLLSGDSRTAVVEMAAASGLYLLSSEERNPLITSTYGTGELIAHAIGSGIKNLLVCIGGSATNDGGAGAARALGIRFTDAEGNEIAEGGYALRNLHHIDISSSLCANTDINVLVACDVTNPLLGDAGASAVYGPQKGADSDMVQKLDEALANYAKIIQKDLGLDVANLPGAGAAGGLGAGLVAFCGAQLKSGIDIVLDAVKFDAQLSNADLVITGEGSLDAQTACGKTIRGVLERSKNAGVPCVAFGGKIGDVEALYNAGIASVFPIASGPMSLEQSMAEASVLLEQASERVFRLLKNISQK